MSKKEVLFISKESYLFAVCLAVALCIAIAGCSFFGETEVYFIATVLESTESSLLVEPQAGSSELSSADKIVVAIEDVPLVDAENKEITWEDIIVGERIEITYDGKIAESYPAQIRKCYKVRLID